MNRATLMPSLPLVLLLLALLVGCSHDQSMRALGEKTEPRATQDQEATASSVVNRRERHQDQQPPCRLRHPEFSKTRVAALVTGTTVDQVAVLFGKPDSIETRLVGRDTSEPWQGLCHVYRMTGHPDDSAATQNTLVYSRFGGALVLEGYRIQTVYPDEEVPAFSHLPQYLDLRPLSVIIEKHVERARTPATAPEGFTTKLEAALRAWGEKDYETTESASKAVIAALKFGDDGDVPDFMAGVAVHVLLDAYREQGKYVEGERACREYVAQLHRELWEARGMAAAFWNTEDWKLTLSVKYENLAGALDRYSEFLDKLGRTQEASEVRVEAKALRHTSQITTAPA